MADVISSSIPASDTDDAPDYLLARDPNGYSAAWADRRIRRIVLVTAFPVVFLGFPVGLLYFVMMTWYAAGFRCPRCRERFAPRRLSLLLGRACTACALPAGSKRDLTESPMFPRLYAGRTRHGVGGLRPLGERPVPLDERGDETNPFRPPGFD